MADHITEEIREIRHKLAEQCDNDVDLIFEKLLKGASSSDRNYILLPMRATSIKIATEQGSSDDQRTVL